ncbi:8809_t:CDS:1, partial [Racocetra persica]
DPYYVNVPPGRPQKAISVAAIVAIVIICLAVLIIAILLFLKRKKIAKWWKDRKH